MEKADELFGEINKLSNMTELKQTIKLTIKEIIGKFERDYDVTSHPVMFNVHYTLNHILDEHFSGISVKSVLSSIAGMAITDGYANSTDDTYSALVAYLTYEVIDTLRLLESGTNDECLDGFKEILKTLSVISKGCKCPGVTIKLNNLDSMMDYYFRNYRKGNPGFARASAKVDLRSGVNEYYRKAS